jgi:hypothetical protein
MVKSKLKSLFVLAALFICSSASTAFAAGNYSIPTANAVSKIGVRSGGGGVWVGTSTNGGTSCTWKNLSVGTSPDNGLVENWNINGTNFNDTIEIVTSSTSWCGRTLSSFSPSHTINLFGQNGHDILNGGFASTAVNGMAGNDRLRCRRASCVADGGSGDDRFDGVESTTLRFFGSTGDDLMCISNATGTGPGFIALADGGSNNTSFPFGDGRCGAGVIDSGFENWDRCAACGIP